MKNPLGPNSADVERRLEGVIYVKILHYHLNMAYLSSNSDPSLQAKHIVQDLSALIQANSASIKLSEPGSYVQILTTLKPVDSSSTRQCCSVRSHAELMAIMTMSKDVLSQ